MAVNLIELPCSPNCLAGGSVLFPQKGILKVEFVYKGSDEKPVCGGKGQKIKEGTIAGAESSWV